VLISGALLLDCCPCNLISHKIGPLLFEKGKQKLSLLPWLVLRYIPKRDVFAHGSLDLSSFSLWSEAVQLLYSAMVWKKNNANGRGGSELADCVHIRVVANFTPAFKVNFKLKICWEVNVCVLGYAILITLDCKQDIKILRPMIVDSWRNMNE
jgi:hypothetical protein